MKDPISLVIMIDLDIPWRSLGGKQEFLRKDVY